MFDTLTKKLVVSLKISEELINYLVPFFVLGLRWEIQIDTYFLIN